MSQSSPPPTTSPTPPPAPPTLPIPDNWQKRATEAESSLTALNARVADLEKQLKQQTDAVAAAQSARDLEAAGALDFEVVRTIVDTLLRQTSFPTFADAVAELKRRKPFLFRASNNRIATPAPAGAASPAPPQAPRGDRRSILDYLRSRRS